MPVSTVDRSSANGNDIQTPYTPYIFERKKTNGIKKKTCLESVSINAGKALPIAWKYAEPIN